MIKNFLRTTILIGLLGCTTVRASSAVPVTISLDPKVVYQTITGWEATAEAGQVECAGFDLYKDEVYDLAVNDLGINRLRLPIKSGSENPVDWFGLYLNGEVSREVSRNHWAEIINDNNDPKVINAEGFHFTEMDDRIEKVVLPVQERLNRLGKTLYLNVNYVDFGKSSFEHKNHPQEYAEFVLATYLHMQNKYGFVPDAWEVNLEPEHAEWSAEQIGQAIVAAGGLLEENGFTPQFITPSTTAMSTAIGYYEKIIAVPGASDYITELAYHRYAGVSVENLQTIAKLAGENGVDTSMLELIGATHETLHEDLKIGNNSAWQQYTLAYCSKQDNGGAYYRIENKDPAHPVVQEGRLTRFLRQYFKYILSGAVRIEATSSNPQFDALGFVNPDGGTVVVVKTAKAGDLSIEGLPPGVYEASYTTKADAQTVPAVTIQSPGEPFVAAIPAAGVISIYRIEPLPVSQSSSESSCP